MLIAQTNIQHGAFHVSLGYLQLLDTLSPETGCSLEVTALKSEVVGIAVKTTETSPKPRTAYHTFIFIF